MVERFGSPVACRPRGRGTTRSAPLLPFTLSPSFCVPAYSTAAADAYEGCHSLQEGGNGRETGAHFSRKCSRFGGTQAGKRDGDRKGSAPHGARARGYDRGAAFR